MTGALAQQRARPPLTISRVQGDLDNDDHATAQTIRIMCGHIQESANDPLVRAIAEGCKQSAAANGHANDPRAIAAACWWKVKHGMKFTQDDELIRCLLNEEDQLELLIAPAVMVRVGRAQGDCDDFTMMICSLLRAAGIPYEIVTVAADHSQPQRYSHVFARAVMPDGSRVPMDCSHGKYPGWQVPVEDTLRLQVWDEGGNPISDAAPRPARLHGYRPGRGLGACGTDPSSGEQFCSPDTVTTSASPWTGVLASLANQWTQIGGRVLAPTTIAERTPTGAIHLETPGSSPSLLTTFGAGTAGGGGSLLLWGGLGLVVIIGLAAMSRGRRG